MITVSEKKPSTTARRTAPRFGICLPRRREMIATPIEIQMKTSLKAKSPHVASPIPEMLRFHAAVAVNASEPPTQSGFVIQ
jgi:hypothetical protein